MQIQDFLSIAIVGVGASLIIEGVTRLSGTKPLTSKFVAVGISVIIGTGYYFAQQTAWWPTVLTVLGSASTIYALLFKSNK